MTATKTEPTTLETRKTIKAPVERVWKAWTEPEQMTKWFGCFETTSVLITQDFRVGGDYRVCCNCADRELATMYGTFQEIEPNRKLVYTWNNTSAEYPAKDTVVSVEFLANGNETEIVLKHTKFAIPLSVVGHSMGWESALNKFADLFVEQKAS